MCRPQRLLLPHGCMHSGKLPPAIDPLQPWPKSGCHSPDVHFVACFLYILPTLLALFAVGLEKAMEHLPASLAQQEEQDRKAKAAAKDAEVAELAVVEAQKARAQQLKQEAEKDWEHARRSSLQDVSALPASTLAAFADNDAQPPKTASDLDNEKSHDSPAERTSKPQGEREQQQQPPAESPRAAPVQSVQSPAPVEPEEVKEVAAANGK